MKRDELSGVSYENGLDVELLKSKQKSVVDATKTQKRKLEQVPVA